ncbi:hypothetical protein ACET3Z_004869 [Daucus carota]
MRENRRENRREKRDFQILNWNPDFQWVRKIIRDNPTDQEEVLNWVGSYGFLLENDMLKALGKKNMKLLAPAIARINFLSMKVNKSSLLKASRGDEDAIIEILTYLMNEGWWDRAQKLKLKDFGLDIGVSEARISASEKMIQDFIQTNRELVHPNVLKMVAKKDAEGVHMALNHIHYGSLGKRRLVKEHKKAAHEFCSELRKDLPGSEADENHKTSRDSKELVMKFIFSHADKVEEQIMQKVAYNNDRAISEALSQIHAKSLEASPGVNKAESPTFSDIVKADSKSSEQKFVPVIGSDKRTEFRWESLFFTGFDGVPVVDIWKGVKRVARIKDIVIPAKLDRNSKKFGFIKPVSENDANLLLKTSNQLRIGGKQIRIERARPKSIARLPKSTAQSVPNKVEKVARQREEEGHGKQTKEVFPQVIIEEGLEEWSDMLERSVRMDLVTDYAPDSLMELIFSKGYGDLGVRKRGPNSFLISFPDKQGMDEMDWNALEIEILRISKADIEDLVLPRLAWLNISGLPVCAFSKLCLERILRKWGTLASSSFPTIFHNELSNPKVCLRTPIMEEIKGTLEVSILGKTFSIEINEIRNVVLWKEDTPSLGKGVEYSNSSGEPSAKTVVDLEQSSQHPEFVSVGDHCNDNGDRSINSSVGCSPDECEVDDSVNYIDPTTEELRFRKNRLENWNRNSASTLPIPELVVRSTPNRLKPSTSSQGDSVNTRKWSRRGMDSLSHDSDRLSFTHDVIQDNDESVSPPCQFSKSHSDLCSKLVKMRVKCKGGRSRKSNRGSLFDRNRRLRKRKEVVPDWMVGRYVRVWNLGKTIKARGKIPRAQRRVNKNTVHEHSNNRDRITAEDIYQLGLRLGLKPMKDKGPMLSSIAERL